MDAEQTYNALVEGCSRQSLLMLDNLGITYKLKQRYAHGWLHKFWNKRILFFGAWRSKQIRRWFLHTFRKDLYHRLMRLDKMNRLLRCEFFLNGVMKEADKAMKKAQKEYEATVSKEESIG